MGNMLWAAAMGGPLDDYGNAVSSDKNGNLYIAGNFQGNSDFDPTDNKLTLNSAGKDDIFLCKFDKMKKLEWAQSIGGYSLDDVKCLVVDEASNIYMAGSYRSTCDFNPGPAEMNLYASGGDDVFVCKMSQPGKPAK
jgi:hypothetical protein